MSPIRNTLPLAGLMLACVGLLGCATVSPAQRDSRDPWQRMNRTTYRVDYALYTHVAVPVTKTYVRITPHPIRKGISNFFNNLTYPAVIVNDLLQGQIADFGRDTVRLVIDTTFGIGGLLDPATGMGLARHDRDFGQTFGKWGIPPGPYLALPILGPSDLRDAIGLIPAVFASPLYYVNDPAVTYPAGAAGTLDTATDLLPLLQLDQQAYDHYAFARDAYLSRRKFLVEGNKQQNNAQQELEQLEQPGN